MPTTRVLLLTATAIAAVAVLLVATAAAISTASRLIGGLGAIPLGIALLAALVVLGSFAPSGGNGN